MPLELLFEHMHILGAPGTGKSALGIAPLTAQLIRRNDGPVIVLDLKGDMALFNTARLEAEKAGRQFKWFTNKPNRSTYIFNPWRQGYLEQMTLPEILGLFLLSLNLHHGDDYGRAFFGLKSRSLLRDVLRQALDLESGARRRGSRPPRAPQSFADLERLIRETGGVDQQAGEHLLHVLQTLVDFPQLNLSPLDRESPLAVENAIHMPDVIHGKQVVYFYLQALTDMVSAGEIARLAMYAALSAAVAYREDTGMKPRVYLLADEAQILMAQNIANVLAQAREYGLACILCHQTLSQLNPPGGVDLRDLVLSCTSVKQFWSARNPDQKDHISKISGEVAYYSAAWDQFAHHVDRGQIGRQYAAAHPEEQPYVRVGETVGPRLTAQDIEDYSRQPNTSIMSIERNAGLACFEGAFPVHMDWMMSKAEFDRRNLQMGWPEPTDETIVTAGSWPKYEAAYADGSSNSSHQEEVDGGAERPTGESAEPSSTTPRHFEQSESKKGNTKRRRKKRSTSVPTNEPSCSSVADDNRQEVLDKLERLRSDVDRRRKEP